MNIDNPAKRFMIVIFVLILLIPFLSQYAYALEYVDFTPQDYQKLTNIEATLVLQDEEPDINSFFIGYTEEETHVLVTELVTFEVHQSSRDDLCYELWRDLPEQEVDGLTLDYTVLSVKEVLDDGTKVEYNHSYQLSENSYDSPHHANTWHHSKGPYYRQKDQYECLFIYVDGIYRDTVTFEITYKMNNVALLYRDCSDLYLSLYSESPIKDLKSYKADILIPDKDMPSHGNYEYYTYGSDNNGFDVVESSTKNPGYHTFSIDLDEDDLSFKPYNLYLEFELVAFGNDSHIFTDSANTNDYSRDYALTEIRMEHDDEKTLPSSYFAFKIFILICLIIASLVVLSNTINTKKSLLAKHKFYEPQENTPLYSSIPSDLDPNFAAALVFSKMKKKKNDSGIYSALLISLARKGYITVEDYGVNDAKVTIISNLSEIMEDSIMPMEPLTESETLYYNLLVRHSTNNTVLMNVLQHRISTDYENTASFDEKIKSAIVNIGINEGYIQKADFTEPKDQILHTANKYLDLALIFIFVLNLICAHTRVDLAFGGFFLFGFICLICSIYLRSIACNYVLLTEFGANEYSKWKGLYDYLKSSQNQSDLDITNMPIYERYFIYAIAFGIPTKITETIGIQSPQVVYSPTQSYSPIFNNTYIRSGRIHISSRGISRAVRSGTHFHKASATSRGYTGGGRSFGSYGGGGS